MKEFLSKNNLQHTLLVSVVDFFDFGEVKLRERHNLVLLISLTREEFQVLLAVEGRGVLRGQVIKEFRGGARSEVRVLWDDIGLFSKMTFNQLFCQGQRVKQLKALLCSERLLELPLEV